MTLERAGVAVVLVAIVAALVAAAEHAARERVRNGRAGASVAYRPAVPGTGGIPWSD